MGQPDSLFLDIVQCQSLLFIKVRIFETCLIGFVIPEIFMWDAVLLFIIKKWHWNKLSDITLQFCVILIWIKYYHILEVNNKAAPHKLVICHCVPRAPVCEVLSRLYLFAYCLDPYNTMHFTRFRHCRNATFKLSWQNRVKCSVCGRVISRLHFYVFMITQLL